MTALHTDRPATTIMFIFLKVNAASVHVDLKLAVLLLLGVESGGYVKPAQ